MVVKLEKVCTKWNYVDSGYRDDEEYQKDTTEEELLEMIEDEKQKLKNINLVLEKILNTDFKPKMEIFMYLKYECWLLDCPQHLIIDEN